MNTKLCLPDGLIVANATEFGKKIINLAERGAATLHVVFDFDRTLTVKRPGTDEEVTSWHILGEKLSADDRVTFDALFHKYRALELSGTMTEADAVDWWSSTLDLFVKSRINIADVEATLLERASIRPGTLELFRLLGAHGIPSVILSAGIRDVIEMWCRNYDIHPDLIVSTELTIDAENTIAGWRSDTLVHVLNKSEATHPELVALRQNRPCAILIGDSLDDASMASSGPQTIKVRMFDPRGDEPIMEDEQSKTFERFDARINDGSLEPVRELLERII